MVRGINLCSCVLYVAITKLPASQIMIISNTELEGPSCDVGQFLEAALSNELTKQSSKSTNGFATSAQIGWGWLLPWCFSTFFKFPAKISTTSLNLCSCPTCMLPDYFFFSCVLALLHYKRQLCSLFRLQLSHLRAQQTLLTSIFYQFFCSLLKNEK